MRRVSAALTPAGPCPGDNTLSALVEGAASRDEALIEHLSRCDACQLLVAEMVRADDDSAPRYQIEALIGTGGMGLVLRAFDNVLERQVAVKLLWDASDSVLGEARILARFSHPNIVTVHDAGVLEHLGAPFIAMELIKGESLREWLYQPRSWQDVVRVFDAAGRGLAAAHEHDVVHADFKPANVLLTDDGARVLVTDFGLARRDEERTATPVGGTPRYVAPELAHRSPNARSDQFAFGVALYEALFGTHPIRGDAAPAPGCKGVPARLRRAVARCVDADPERRYPSMEAALRSIAHPIRRSRGWWGAGATAVVAIAAVAITRDPCGEASAQRQWEASLQPQLRAAMDADAWTRVAPRADAWVASWVERDELECRGEASAVVRACLDAHWATLEALTDRVGAAPAGAAPLALATLPKVSECQRPTGDVASPVVAAERITESASALAHARAGLLLGDGVGTQADLVRAVEVARASDLPGLEAEAKLLLAKVRWESGNVDEAFEDFSSAGELALRAGLPDLAAEAMGAAAMFVAYFRRDVAVARSLMKQARSVASRGTDATTVLDLDRNEAWILSVEEDHAGAAKLMRSVRERLEGDPLAKAAVSADLALFLRQAGDLPGGLLEIERAIELRIEALGKEHPRVAQLAIHRASLLGSADRFDEAAGVLLDAMEQLPDAMASVAHLQRASMLLDAGRVDEAETALALGREAFIGTASPDASKAELVRRLEAGVALGKGDAARAREILQKLLEQSPGADARSPGDVSNLHRDLGRAELALGNYDQAQRWLELALTHTSVYLTTEGDMQIELARALAAGGTCGPASRAAAERAIAAWQEKASAVSFARAEDAQRWLRTCADPAKR